MFCCFCRQTSGIAIELLALANLLFLLSGLRTATQVLWKETATWGKEAFSCFSIQKQWVMLVEIRSFPGTVILQTCCANSSTRKGLCAGPGAQLSPRSLCGSEVQQLQPCSIQYSQCYLFSKVVSKILFHLIVELCVYPLPHLKPVLVKVTNMMQYSRK